jgi:serine protease AprX
MTTFTRSPRPLLPALLCALAFACATAASAGTPATRLDPRLAPLLAAGAEPAAVWVTFADKGEAGPSDLAAKLAAAEAALTPEARRRRERAGMRPLVDWLDLPIEPRYVEELQAQGFSPYGQSRWFNGCAVRASGEALVRLASLPFVTGVAPVDLAAPRPARPVPADLPQDGPALDGAFGALRTSAVAYGQTATQLARLNVPALHDSGYTGAGVMICMLDEGFNYYNKHEATRNIDVGNRTRDFIDGDASVQDTVIAPGYYSHGQWTLSAIGGNKPGRYVGPAFGAKFALARTENSASEKPIEMVWWAMGAEWADSLGADVISSSLGYTTFPDSAGGAYSLTWPMMNGHTSIVTRAAQIAASRGILVVNSAGNDGNAPFPANKLSAPSDANGDSVLCIAAVDSFGVRATYSSKGPTYDGRIKPDLAAQGTQVLLASAAGGVNTYTRANGTSFSCPLTAGLAACLIQARPNWSATQVIRALRETATQATHPDTLLGYGIPSGLAAMGWVPDTSDVPGGTSPGLSFTWRGSNPVRPDGWPIALQFAIGSGAPAPARIRVYDMQGRIVATPWSGSVAPGHVATVAWDGGTDLGPLGPGLYFLAFESGGDRVTRRLVALR